MTSPSAASTATLLTFPQRGDDRLRLALRGLLAALDAQAEAAAGLRAEMRCLAGAAQGLEGSLLAYRDELGSTLDATRQANREARTLERSVEGWLTAAGR